MAHYEELNLLAVIKEWSMETFDTSNDDGRLDARKCEFDIDITKLKFKDLSPQYVPSRESNPRTEVVSESTFRNDTNRVQFHSFKVERETTSIGKIDISRALMIDGKTRLNLTELPSGVPHTLGFGSELSLSQSGGQEFRESMKWTADTQVKVPAGITTKAELAITENSFESNFTVKTEIRGNVHVNIRVGNTVKATQDGDIVEILKQHNKIKKIQGLKFPGASKGGRTCAMFESTGSCKFRFGVSQNVNLSHQGNCEEDEEEEEGHGDYYGSGYQGSY